MPRSPRRRIVKTRPVQRGRSRAWKLEDAKARFSELVRLARSVGPQHVTVRGIAQVADVRFRGELMGWLDRTLRPWFGARILEVDEDVIVEWRRMVARGRAVNHTFSQPDLFVAATAAVHRLAVVTRNVMDFRIANVPVFDPWLPSGTEPR